MPTVSASLDRFELVGRNIRLIDGRLTTEGHTRGRAPGYGLGGAQRGQVAKVPLEDALRAASLTPARFLGLDNERGTLVPNAPADLVALSEELQVVATWVGGIMDDLRS